MIICDRMASTVGWKIMGLKDALSIKIAQYRCLYLLLQKLQELLSSNAR